MNKAIQTMLLAAGALALSGHAYADTVSLSGDIDGTEPTFDQPISTASILTHYDTYEFTVDADGMYSFLSFYAGDTSVDANMDGTLFVYAPFDPNAPSAGIVGSDDDYLTGDVAALAGLDGDCSGSNCSGFEVALSAGVTYVLVQSTFTDTPTSFGQPTGPYDITITGPGGINIVPIPGAVWLMASALAGFGALRRRG